MRASPDGVPVFEPITPPTDTEIRKLVRSLAARIARVLRRHDRETDLEPDPLTACYATAVQGRLAFGEHAGAHAPRIGDARAHHAQARDG